jgi:uncharacterized membrane protein YbhN (UPF0104 family)
MAALSALPVGVRSGARVIAAVVVVGATIAVVGVGSFLDGLSAVSPAAVAAALALTAAATAAAAWRWRVVSCGFGLPLRWHEAFGAYYRSQFLNVVLPGGVVGDVHRAVAHGRRQDRLDMAARAVAAERIAGQLVQLALTLAVLLPLGLTSPLAPLAAVTAVAAALTALAVGVVAASRRGRDLLRREYRILRPVLASPRRMVAIAVASTVVVAAHAATFVVAGVAAGLHADPRALGIAALIVLAASALPLNVAGWGPREAVAASAFALMGLGAAAGLAVSTAFGVLTLVAVAPGALVLLRERFRRVPPRGMIGSRRSG